MKIGTKSVLFGYHCFAVHPWFVALAWWQLYGFPWDPRLWAAFFVHDLGYFGKPNIDGPEGETHPELGRKIMQRLFGREWGDFTFLHSRFVAKNYGVPWSRLCIADKLATAITPRWLFLLLANASGEIHEYMCEKAVGNSQRVESAMFTRGLCEGITPEKWHHNMTTFVRKWAWDNRTVAPSPQLALAAPSPQLACMRTFPCPHNHPAGCPCGICDSDVPGPTPVTWIGECVCGFRGEMPDGEIDGICPKCKSSVVMEVPFGEPSDGDPLDAS